MKVSIVKNPLNVTRILACVLTLSLSGCATLLKGSDSTVAIQAPQGTTVSEDGYPLHRIPRRDGFLLYLRSSRQHDLRFEYQGQEKYVHLDPTPEMDWVIADLLFVPPISHLFDIATEDWCSFDYIRFVNADSSMPPSLDSFELIDPIKKRVGKWTILAHVGAGFPIYQIPLILTHAGISVGYQPISKTEFTVGAEINGDLDFGTQDSVDYVGSATLFTLRAKYLLFGSVFIDAKAAYAKIRLTETNSHSYLPYTAIPLTSQNLFLIGPGIGFEGRYAFIEFQQYYGLKPLRLYGAGGPFRIFTVSFGIHGHF